MEVPRHGKIWPAAPQTGGEVVDDGGGQHHAGAAVPAYKGLLAMIIYITGVLGFIEKVITLWYFNVLACT